MKIVLSISLMTFLILLSFPLTVLAQWDVAPPQQGEIPDLNPHTGTGGGGSSYTSVPTPNPIFWTAVGVIALVIAILSVIGVVRLIRSRQGHRSNLPLPPPPP
jgi:ABC-type dipeptide/oligopeptide/nickel transport system permease subunit